MKRAAKSALAAIVAVFLISVPTMAQDTSQPQPPNSGANTPSASDNLPNAPSASQNEDNQNENNQNEKKTGSQETKPDNKTEPSLSDLGFPTEQTKPDPKMQALLDKRTHMLKIHQRMGLITAGPLLATVLTSLNAGGKNTSNTDRNVHLVLGAVTGDLYGITAYYAIRAPRVPGTQTRGPIRFHKAMAYIHVPGMILTPILGAMAYSQKNNGEKVHGIASAHGPVAIVTAGAFGAALLSVSLKF